jgi:CheY-like chemotaxis protein
MAPSFDYHAMINQYRKVMLIDDEYISNLISAKMMEAAGYTGQVESYTSAEEALKQLSTASDEAAAPDVIFLDIRMPAMNGFEFLEAYEQLPSQQKRSRIYMLSSSDNPQDVERAKSYPSVVAFVSKPLSVAYLQDMA